MEEQGAQDELYPIAVLIDELKVRALEGDPSFDAYTVVDTTRSMTTYYCD